MPEATGRKMIRRISCLQVPFPSCKDGHVLYFFFPFYRLRRIFICLYGDSMRKGKEKEVTEQEKITDTVRGREAKNKEN